MKTKLSLVLGGLLLMSQGAMAQLSAPQTYTLQAVVPASTSVGITATSVNSSGTPVYTPVTGTTLSFGTLTYTTTGTPAINVYLPANYYFLDIAVAGAGTPQATLTYVDTLNPNGASNGLGSKSAITFDKEVYTGPTTAPTESILNSVGTSGKSTLSGLTGGLTVPFALVSGGWLRTYLGICTGNASTDASGCKAFTGADAPGTYAGTLTVTATIH